MQYGTLDWDKWYEIITGGSENDFKFRSNFFRINQHNYPRINTSAVIVEMDLKKLVLFINVFYLAPFSKANSNQEFYGNEFQRFKLPELPSVPSFKNKIALERLFELYTLQSKSERSDLCREQSNLLLKSAEEIETIQDLRNSWGLKSKYLFMFKTRVICL